MFNRLESFGTLHVVTVCVNVPNDRA